MKKKIIKSRAFILIVILDIMLICAIFYLMNYVKILLNDDIRINLTEIVTQNKNVITSKLTLELNNLEMEARQISDRFTQNLPADASGMREIFLDYTQERNNTSLIWADSDGKSVTGKGESLEISGRKYFQLGMEGTPNISDRLISRLNGDDIFMICVPLYYNNEIVGTLQKQYSPTEMYNLCSVSLFSEQGASYIINNEGYILICSENSQYTHESDNYFRIIYLTDQTASKRLENDIRQNQSGFLEAVIDGKKVFSAYTPIDQIHDWYLISSISTDAVSPNSLVVVRLFYCVLLVNALLFTFSIFFYWSMKRKQQQDLERVAFVDTVTGGRSYTRFLLDLRNLMSENQDTVYHICAFDIDNFKYINNFYGFEKGDSILKHIYQMYDKLLSTDERIARISGDHFVLLLSDVSEDRLLQLVSTELCFDDITIYLSAGLYQISNRDESVSLMIDKASTAAQTVKGIRFKHIAVYSKSYDEEIAQNEQIKRSIELALADNEIVPFFQPKVDILTRKLVGAEALARWHTKDGKLVSPGVFIPVCEKTGLIGLVDMTIFEQTLAFLKSNIDKGIPCVPISVNFSRLHLLNVEFMDTILQKLEQYQVPPSLIELELTETVIYDNYETIQTFIQNLHQYGLRVSMDDFGSGYSSLHMLKDVEIDVLKIDRGFLLGTSSNNRQSVILGTIVHMAHELNIKVVVEGVETDENVDLMKSFECYTAQGFYFARPMDVDSFASLFEKGYV